jgi:hypothetical protein
MFSDPRYLCSDVACIARLRDGSYVDLMRGGTAVANPKLRPAQPPSFANVREMIAATALSYPENIVFRPGYLEFLAHRWQQRHPAAVQEVLENTLSYYPFGPHPGSATTPVIELFQLDRRAQGAYSMGRREGPWLMYHDNGVKGGAGEFRNGVAVGKWSFWDEKGRLTAEGMMKDGRQIGEWRILRHDVPEGEENGSCPVSRSDKKH